MKPTNLYEEVIAAFRHLPKKEKVKLLRKVHGPVLPGYLDARPGMFYITIVSYITFHNITLRELQIRIQLLKLANLY